MNQSHTPQLLHWRVETRESNVGDNTIEARIVRVFIVV